VLDNLDADSVDTLLECDDKIRQSKLIKLNKQNLNLSQLIVIDDVRL